jgi:hypothetical protein
MPAQDDGSEDMPIEDWKAARSPFVWRSIEQVEVTIRL